MASQVLILILIEEHFNIVQEALMAIGFVILAFTSTILVPDQFLILLRATSLSFI